MDAKLIEELRQKYIKNPPEGMTSNLVKNMTDSDLFHWIPAIKICHYTAHRLNANAFKFTAKFFYKMDPGYILEILFLFYYLFIRHRTITSYCSLKYSLLFLKQVGFNIIFSSYLLKFILFQILCL